jgi:hypothetical protein
MLLHSRFDEKPNIDAPFPHWNAWVDTGGRPQQGALDHAMVGLLWLAEMLC